MDVLAVTEGSGHWIRDLLLFLTVPALVLLNGLFVAAEFSLVAVRRTRVEEMVRHGVSGARAVETAVTHLTRSIAAIQLGITLASIGLGFAGEPALARLVTPLFQSFGEAWRESAAHTVASILAFMLITFMHVVFGEVIPKSMALQMPDRIALWLARPLLVFAFLTRPLILLINGTSTRLLHWLGFLTPPGEGMVHSVEELILLIEDTEEAGILDSDQADFVENVFRLSTKKVGQCMMPRDKMACLELNTPPDKVLEIVRNGAHTRMPVYEGELDQIVGVVNTKDLFYLFSLQGIVVLQDALYPALYLDPEEPLDNALRLFRKSRKHMALVRNDANKILGLITLEDVLEEIVGDIEDEHDRPTPKLQPRKRGVVSPEKAALLRGGLVPKPPAPGTPSDKKA